MGKKIFVTSLHRTATQSTHYMLEDAGLRSLHWPAVYEGRDIQAMIKDREMDYPYIAECLEPIIAAHDSVSDVPIPGIYEELNKIYPESLFVTIVRPVDDWIASVRKHIGTEREFDPFEKVVYWKYISRRPARITDISDEEMRQLFENHINQIGAFFPGGENHIFCDLSDPSIGEKICNFLGVEPRPLPKRDYLAEM